ncbi:MAG: hypothetical protein Kow0047_10670 [Anaerolineae bacterium]
MYSELVARFRDPPAQARPWVRWWWFGNAMTRDEIDRELRFIKASGWGGVELQPVYAWPDGPQGPPMLSDEWFDLVEHAVTKAAELGLGFDLTFGSGWPFGGPHIPPEAQARTLKAITRQVDGPGTVDLTLELPASDRLVGWWAAPITDPQSPPRVRFTEARQLEGPTWDAPPGHWAVTAFVETPTGQRVKRAGPGGEGFVHDHLSRRGLQAHIDGWGEPTCRRLAEHLGQSLRALFCDSWEVQGPYWTTDFLVAFRQRRGYDLGPYLPLLLGQWHAVDLDADAIAGMRYDYRRTVAELAMDEFYRPLAEFCHAHGLKVRVQAHGSPTDWLESYGSADFPETEAILIPIAATRLAASASRLYGRTPVTSESFTCLYGWPAVKMFAERPDDLKAIADGQFACGLQQVFYHGYAASPPEAGTTPGWHFYASAHINHTIPWREHLPVLNGYLARVSALMQAGVAVTDIAVYQPIHDRWRDAVRVTGPEGEHADMFQWPDAKEAPQPPAEIAGYTFDWVNDDALERMSVEQGTLVLREQRYQALVLDHVRRLPLSTAQRIRALVEQGAALIILGDAPVGAPGLGDGPEASREVAAIFARLCADPHLPVYRDVRRLQAERGCQPDLVAHDQSGQPVDVWWAHRRVGDVDVYFIAHPNVTRLRYPIPYRDAAERSTEVMRLRLSLRVAGRVAEWWDAETGERFALPCAEGEGRTEVELDFGPNQAHILIFVPTEEADVLTPLATPGAREVALAGPWLVALPDGSSEIWRDLHDWRQDPRLRDFSGTIVYRQIFELDEIQEPVFLDLGGVEVAAEVQVNGQSLGARLWAPYRWRLDGRLRPGRNDITIRVSNLLYNAVQGERQRLGHVPPIPGLRPPEWEHVKALGLVDPIDERRPSGLLGPVRLLY